MILQWTMDNALLRSVAGWNCKVYVDVLHRGHYVLVQYGVLVVVLYQDNRRSVWNCHIAHPPG